MILSDGDQTVPLHLSKLLGQGASLQIQVIRQLLTVEGNIKFVGVLLERDCIQIRQNPSPDRLWRGMKASFGQRQILMCGNR